MTPRRRFLQALCALALAPALCRAAGRLEVEPEWPEIETPEPWTSAWPCSMLIENTVTGQKQMFDWTGTEWRRLSDIEYQNWKP